MKYRLLGAIVVSGLALLIAVQAHATPLSMLVSGVSGSTFLALFGTAVVGLELCRRRRSRWQRTASLRLLLQLP
jgi:hypothetical protein